MTQRTAIGAALIAILFAAFALDALLASDPPWGSNLLARGSVLPLAIAGIALLACYEVAALLRRTGLTPHHHWAGICCIGLVLAPWFSAGGRLGRGPLDLEPFNLQIELVAFAVIGAGIIAVLRQQTVDGLTNLAATTLLITYAGILPSFWTIVRCDSHLPGEYGAWLLLLLIAVCKAADIGAYYVGSLAGRRKLVPKVSPAKSVEGLVGAIAGSCTVALLILGIQRSINIDESTLVGIRLDDRWLLLLDDITFLFARLSIPQTLVLASVMAIAGQFGDLVESIFKRCAGAKDSADLLPGFGGILDMIDSPLMAAPPAWFLLTRVWDVL